MIDIKRFRSDKKINQKEVCEILNIAQPYLSAIEQGKRPLNEEKFKLLYKHYGDIILEYKNTNIVVNMSNSHENEENSKNLIPFYDDVVTIGGINERIANMEGVAEPADYIDTGDWFKDATAALRHYGDSMLEYMPGSILALKEVKERQLVVWGKDYVIETNEYRITKRIQKGTDDDHIKAYSTNIETYPDGQLMHEPLKISWEDINRIYIVLGYVVKKNGGTMVFSGRKSTLNQDNYGL